MKKKFFLLSLLSLLLLFQCFLILNCGKNKPDKKLVQLWSSFSTAVDQRNEVKAKQFLAKESREYFHLSPWQYPSSAKLTVVKVEKYSDYTKLHILVEENGQQSALFRYVVFENGKPLLQYPFLIFAKDWPTDTTDHFIIHYKVRPKYREGIFDSTLADSDTLRVKVAEIEKFYSTMSNLLGVTYPGKIDYYLCSDLQEVGELAGIKPFPRFHFGKAIITVDKEDLVEIAYFLGRQIKQPFYQLYSGLNLYASAEKTRQLTRVTPSELVYSMVLPDYYPKETSIIPRIFKMDTEATEQGSQAEFDAICGAVVYYLATEFDQSKFAFLYQESHDYESFERALAKNYGLDIYTLEQRIKQKM